MIKRVLVANRGEIALRIFRTLKSMGIHSIAVYDDRELKSAYLEYADEAFSLGSGHPESTFLNIDKIIDIAKSAKADALHPGYGFLSENPVFAETITSEGIIYIGPSVNSLKLFGNKWQARQFAVKLGIPVAKAYNGSDSELTRLLSSSDFPILVKPQWGGGGKSIRVYNSIEELQADFDKKTGYNALTYNNGYFFEKFIPDIRHVEVQILGDMNGNVLPLFDRECTVQRKFQKIIEEAPVPFIKDDLRERIISDALKIAKQSGYYSAGTIEFMLDKTGNYYFLEANARIQVEHGVTEIITGVDIVREQINIAENGKLPDYLYGIKPTGHAIEARIYAEDPDKEFMPSSGKISLVNLPDGEDIRIDHSLKPGDVICEDFDPLLAKIIVKRHNRTEAVNRITEILTNTAIHGIRHNIGLLTDVFQSEEFNSGNFSTRHITTRYHYSNIFNSPDLEIAFAGLFISLMKLPEEKEALSHLPYHGYWRIYQVISCSINEINYRFVITRITEDLMTLRYQGNEYTFICKSLTNDVINFTDESGKNRRLIYSFNDDNYTINLGSGPVQYFFFRDDLLGRKCENRNTSEEGHHHIITAPLNGKILKINTFNEEFIEKGKSLVIIESMKMENEIRMPVKGKVKKIHIKTGDHVREGDVMFELEMI